MLRPCLLTSFIEFYSIVAEEKSKMSQPIRNQGGHLVLPIGPKNINLVKDVEILIPDKFRWIPFSGCRGEIENVSANQTPGQLSCFSDRPEKHKLDYRTLKSCFLSNFVEFRSAVSEEKSSMSQQIRGQGGHLVFPNGPKNKNLVEDVEILLLVKFSWIRFSGFRGKVENVSANHRPGRSSFFSSSPKHTNLIEDVEILLPVKFRWILFRGKVENVKS